MKKIRIAQIGTSRFGYGNAVFDTLKQRSDLFEIAGYALPENEREKFPDFMHAFDGFREMTVDEILHDETIEAVAVETEEIYLAKYAIMAAEHGKHIQFEKPGSQSLADFERLISAVKKNGKVFHVGYMYRYNPFVAEAIAKAKAGAFGEIINVEAQMNILHPNNLREWLKTFKGGNMFYLGCHLIDIIVSLQGLPKEVIPLNCATARDGIISEDFGMAVLKYDNGVSFAKVTSTEVGGFIRRQVVISGTKGTVEIKPLEEQILSLPYGMTVSKTEHFNTEALFGTPLEDKTVKSDIFTRYEAMLAGFASFVRGEKENPYTPDYELDLYKTVLKCCGEKI